MENNIKTELFYQRTWIPYNVNKAIEVLLAAGHITTRTVLSAAAMIANHGHLLTPEQINLLNKRNHEQT